MVPKNPGGRPPVGPMLFAIPEEPDETEHTDTKTMKNSGTRVKNTYDCINNNLAEIAERSAARAKSLQFLAQSNNTMDQRLEASLALFIEKNNTMDQRLEASLALLIETSKLDIKTDKDAHSCNADDNNQNNENDQNNRRPPDGFNPNKNDIDTTHAQILALLNMIILSQPTKNSTPTIYEDQYAFGRLPKRAQVNGTVDNVVATAATHKQDARNTKPMTDTVAAANKATNTPTLTEYDSTTTKLKDDADVVTYAVATAAAARNADADTNTDAANKNENVNETDSYVRAEADTEINYKLIYEFDSDGNANNNAVHGNATDDVNAAVADTDAKTKNNIKYEPKTKTKNTKSKDDVNADDKKHREYELMDEFDSDNALFFTNNNNDGKTDIDKQNNTGTLKENNHFELIDEFDSDIY